MTLKRFVEALFLWEALPLFAGEKAHNEGRQVFRGISHD